jgi:hypothetical protein
MPWPKTMILPEAGDFEHGSYLSVCGLPKRDVAALNTPTEHVNKYDCGTRACAIGWIGLAFGESIHGLRDGRGSQEATAFAARMVELTGRAPSTWPLRQIEVMFEGWGGGDPMTGDAIAKVWRKAASSFGYRVSEAR